MTIKATVPHLVQMVYYTTTFVVILHFYNRSANVVNLLYIEDVRTSKNTEL